MATSAVIDEYELSTFTSLPIGRKILLPGSARTKHIIDSCDMRRHPARKYRDFAIPIEDSGNPKIASVKFEQKKNRTEIILSERRKNLIYIIQNTTAKWKDLEKREKYLKTYFIQFNKFIRDSVEKRERFLDCRRRYHEQARLRAAQIEILKLELERCKIIHQLLRTEIRKHSMYQTFLQRVLQMSYRYKSIRDLTSTFELIQQSLEKTTEEYLHRAKELEDNHKKMGEMIGKRKTAFLDFGLQLNCLSKKNDELRRKNFEKENLILSICSEILKSSRYYQECLGNIDSLYNLLCRRLGIQDRVPKNDFKKQLIFIKFAWTRKLARSRN